MTVLPPVNTTGRASDVGSAVAAAFGRRDRDPAPAAAPRRAPQPAPVQAVAEDDPMGWDPAEVAAPRRPAAPQRLTLGQLWAANEGAVDEEAEWDPEDVRRAQEGTQPVPQATGAQLAAGALAKMFGRR